MTSATGNVVTYKRAIVVVDHNNVDNAVETLKALQKAKAIENVSRCDMKGETYKAFFVCTNVQKDEGILMQVSSTAEPFVLKALGITTVEPEVLQAKAESWAKGAATDVAVSKYFLDPNADINTVTNLMAKGTEEDEGVESVEFNFLGKDLVMGRSFVEGDIVISGTAIAIAAITGAASGLASRCAQQ